MTDRNFHSPHFVTGSLPLAALLVAGDHLKLCQLKRSGPRAVLFVFDDPEKKGSELQNALEDGSALVSASRFYMQLRVLRRKIDEKIASSEPAEMMYRTRKDHDEYFASQH